MPAPIPSNVTSCNECKLKSDEDEKNFKEEKEEMESLIKTLEIENTKLERKLSSINEKHDNELAYQAEFYEYVYRIIYYTYYKIHHIFTQ